jgi:signal transduction histidine kinase
MSLLAWLRPPRHLLVLFLAVTLAPAAGLIWLGWRLLQQDRALVEQRVQEHRERAADLLVAALEQKLLAVERDLTRSSALRDAQPGDDAVLLVLGPGSADAVPAFRLLYYPVVPPCRDAPAFLFRDGEDREFRLGDHAAAIASFRDLARSPDAAVRAGAYLRIARNLRKASQLEAALTAYQELARLGPVPIDCVPADLVARRARCALLAEMRRSELRGEAEALYADLRGGRWRLDRAVYSVHAEDIKSWIGVDPTADRERLALTVGAEWLWDRWQAVGRGDARGPGRHSMEVEGRLLTFLWNATGDGLVGLVAGPRYAQREWLAGLRTILNTQGVQLALRDRDGRAAPAPASASLLQAARRTASDTGLPWTVVVASADPGADMAQLAARRHLLLSGLVLVVILVSAGSYFTARAFLREMAAARLQSDFVAAVSHEFRTPLASLRQFTENLLDGRVTTEERRFTYFQAQSRATERLHRLVEGLLDFGRMEAGVVGYRLDPLDAGDLARSVVNDFRQDLAGGDVTSDPARRRDHAHHVELTVESDLPVVRGDREALARALWNLLDNAVKYSPGCPTVWVEVARESGEVAIRVRDRGLGIPADEQRQVSRKFFRGSAAKTVGVKGTGIGLAMVQHIVRAHRGRLRLESAPGAGSTFTMVLPTPKQDTVARNRAPDP